MSGIAGKPGEAGGEYTLQKVASIPDSSSNPTHARSSMTHLSNSQKPIPGGASEQSASKEASIVVPDSSSNQSHARSSMTHLSNSHKPIPHPGSSSASKAVTPAASPKSVSHTMRLGRISSSRPSSYTPSSRRTASSVSMSGQTKVGSTFEPSATPVSPSSKPSSNSSTGSGFAGRLDTMKQSTATPLSTTAAASLPKNSCYTVTQKPATTPVVVTQQGLTSTTSTVGTTHTTSPGKPTDLKQDESRVLTLIGNLMHVLLTSIIFVCSQVVPASTQACKQVVWLQLKSFYRAYSPL